MGMSYQSPIELIAEQIETETENEIVRAVQRVGINIDKNELMRALAYDRNQYFMSCYDRDNEIVRCKDCKNWIAGYITDQDDFIPPKCGKYQQMVGHSSDDFCSLAERW